MDTYTRHQLARVSRRRNAIFVNRARNRPLSKGYEELGVVGEWAFAEMCGLMPRTQPGKGGDGGYDFQLPVVFTVDVKTARKADKLLVEEGKIKADIYVLARYVESETVELDARAVYVSGEAELVGWCWATQVKAVEPRDTGRGIVNHCVPRESLRPMAELKRMMGKVCRV